VAYLQGSDERGTNKETFSKAAVFGLSRDILMIDLGDNTSTVRQSNLTQTKNVRF
jgi:hypothetical protein